jgi:hypothetical protein
MALGCQSCLAAASDPTPVHRRADLPRTLGVKLPRDVGYDIRPFWAAGMALRGPGDLVPL